MSVLETDPQPRTPAARFKKASLKRTRMYAYTLSHLRPLKLVSLINPSGPWQGGVQQWVCPANSEPTLGQTLLMIRCASPGASDRAWRIKVKVSPIWWRRRRVQQEKSKKGEKRTAGMTNMKSVWRFDTTNYSIYYQPTSFTWQETLTAT